MFTLNQKHDQKRNGKTALKIIIMRIKMSCLFWKCSIRKEEFSRINTIYKHTKICKRQKINNKKTQQQQFFDTPRMFSLSCTYLLTHWALSIPSKILKWKWQKCLQLSSAHSLTFVRTQELAIFHKTIMRQKAYFRILFALFFF